MTCDSTRGRYCHPSSGTVPPQPFWVGLNERVHPDPSGGSVRPCAEYSRPCVQLHMLTTPTVPLVFDANSTCAGLLAHRLRGTGLQAAGYVPFSAGSVTISRGLRRTAAASTNGSCDRKRLHASADLLNESFVLSHPVLPPSGRLPQAFNVFIHTVRANTTHCHRACFCRDRAMNEQRRHKLNHPAEMDTFTTYLSVTAARTGIGWKRYC